MPSSEPRKRLIDVTLRDGGHAVDFSWDPLFMQRYLQASRASQNFEYVELGYWKQSGKSSGYAYGLNETRVEEITLGSHSGIAVMVDFHYAPKDLGAYPDLSGPGSFELLRIATRQQDLEDARRFAAALRAEHGFLVSLNLTNITTYRDGELEAVSSSFGAGEVDAIFVADTHGSLNLRKRRKLFESVRTNFVAKGIDFGWHLHNHSGLALANYLEAQTISRESDLVDVSLGGLGKGGGNLPTEQVARDAWVDLQSDVFFDLGMLEKLPSCPYLAISADANITDQWATAARARGIAPSAFRRFALKQAQAGPNKFDPDLESFKLLD